MVGNATEAREVLAERTKTSPGRLIGIVMYAKRRRRGAATIRQRDVPRRAISTVLH